MYLTKNLYSQNDEQIFEFIRRYPFAVLSSAKMEFGESAYLPLILNDSDSEKRMFYGHLDSANPMLKNLDATKVTAVFVGPNGYISPRDYISSQLPTWNFSIAKTLGFCRLVTNHNEKLSLMVKMVNHLEGDGRQSYRLNVKDPNISNLLNTITFFIIEIDTRSGIFKFSQEKSMEDTISARDNLLRKLKITNEKSFDDLFSSRG